MKKIIFPFLFCLTSLFSFGQANTYFHDRIDTTIYVVADTVGHGANNYYATNLSPDFNISKYVNGCMVNLFFKKGNTGSATLTLITKSGTLAQTTIKEANGQLLVSGDIPDSTSVILTYFNGAFRITCIGVTGSSVDWTLKGNAGTTPGTNYAGTSDSIDFSLGTNAKRRLTILANAGYVGIGTVTPTAKLHVVGTGTTPATYVAKFEDVNNVNLFKIHNSGQIEAGNAITNNFFVGVNSGLSITSGGSNNAFGREALRDVTSGYQNNAFGNTVLSNDTSGANNTGMGFNSLLANLSGNNNTSIGFGACRNGTTANQNTAVGVQCLYNNNGEENTGMGYVCLNANTSGQWNTAVGAYAINGGNGSNNTAMGRLALYDHTSGVNNVAIGLSAFQELSSGSNSVALGYQAGMNQTTESNLLFIDNQNRGTAQGEKNSALIYGKFDATPANQILVVNGALYMKSTGTSTNYWTITIVNGAIVLTDTGSGNAP